MKRPVTTPTRRTVALVLLLAYMALIFGGSSGPAPKALADLDIPDYILHVLEYAVLGFLAARWLLHLTLRTGPGVLLLLPVVISAAYGLTDELHQSFVGRDASAADLLSDAVGGLLGALVYRTLLISGLRRGARAAAAPALLLLLLVGTTLAGGAPDDPLREAADSITVEDARRHAGFLASDELRGRNSPSPDLDLAARYIAERFRSLGLEPAGGKGSWFQPVPMVYRLDEDESFIRVLSGSGAVTFAGKDVALLRESPDGDGGGPLVFAGYGIVAPKLGRDDFAGLDVTGKIVMVLTGYPGMNDRKSPFRSTRDRSVTAQRQISGKAKNAADRGAVGVIVVTGPKSGTVDRVHLADGTVIEGKLEKLSGGYRIEIPAYRRQALKPAEIARIVMKDGRELFPRTGRGAQDLPVTTTKEVRTLSLEDVSRVEEDVVPRPRGTLGSGYLRSGRPPAGPAPVIRVSAEVAEALLEGTGKDLSTLQEVLEKETASFEIEGRAAVVRVRTRLEDRAARNVVGRLPGREREDEAVILTAHYDHVGVGADGSIHNGADDNASGTVMVIEVAEAFVRSGLTPRRPVYFVAFAAEEKGMVGSRRFVSEPPLPLDAILVNLNMDMVGRGVADEIEIFTGPMGTDLQSVLQAAEESARLRPTFRTAVLEKAKLPPRTGREKLNLKIPKSPQNLFGRSDHASFYRKGIPAAFFFGGFHADYHKPTDSVEKLNFEKMVRVGRFVFRGAFALAEEGLRPAPGEGAGSTR